MGKVISVNDRMQRNYRNELTAPEGRDFDPGSGPSDPAPPFAPIWINFMVSRQG